jgi:uncharacterized iron-regulated protein
VNRMTLSLCLLLLSTPCLAQQKKQPRSLKAAGKLLSGRIFAKKVRAARLVYVGEEHGNKDHHLLQRDVLDIMSKAGPTVLAVEYFPRSLQPILDRFHAGEISLKDFPKAIDWKKTWGHPYAVYEPLFRLCKKRRIRIVALNAERATVKKVRRNGFSKGFTPKELLLLPRIDLDNRAHQQRIHKALLKVHPMPKAMLNHFYQAFTLWDESMAESTAEILLRDRRKSLRILVVAGRAHISHYTGIPDRVKRRVDLPRLTILCDSSNNATAESADVVYSSGKPRKKAKLY